MSHSVACNKPIRLLKSHTLKVPLESHSKAPNMAHTNMQTQMTTPDPAGTNSRPWRTYSMCVPIFTCGGHQAPSTGWQLPRWQYTLLNGQRLSDNHSEWTWCLWMNMYCCRLLTYCTDRRKKKQFQFRISRYILVWMKRSKIYHCIWTCPGTTFSNQLLFYVEVNLNRWGQLFCYFMLLYP